MAAVAYVGSVGGALIGLHIPKAAFNPIILVMLVVVGAYTLLKPDLGRETAAAVSTATGTRVVAMLIGFVIGVYDGALGPGTGSFLVFALVGLMGYAFLEASAKAKIANFATNLGALTVFAPGRLHHVSRSVSSWPWPTSSAATSAPGPPCPRGSGFVRVVFIVVVSAFIVRISLQLLGVWP